MYAKKTVNNLLCKEITNSAYGDIKFEELLGLNVEYKDKLENNKKTNTKFYIAELSCVK